MSKTAMIILAIGAEEMEFVIVADVLRRAGITVTVAGLKNEKAVKCSRDVVIVPDSSLEKNKDKKFDAIVLPGGLEGSNFMAESKLLGDILKAHETGGRFVCAICAAPTALAKHGIFLGKSITSYPGLKGKFDKYKYVEDKNVVMDGHLITSRGPGTAFEFALKIAEVLVGEPKASEVAKALLLN